MKGLVNVEFILSVTVFLTVVSFITITVINSIPLYNQESVNNNIKMKVYQISEVLMFDKGNPDNWETLSDYNNINLIGLSSGDDYVLDENKINKMNEICTNNYNIIRDMFDADVIINIEDSDGNFYATCNPSVISTGRVKFNIKRVGVLGNIILKMDVTVVE